MKQFEDHQLLFEKTRVHFLLNQNPIFMLGLFGNIVGFVYISWSLVEHSYLIFWLMLSLLLVITRVFYVTKYSKKIFAINQLDKVLKIEKIYAIGSLLSALMWAAAYTFLLPSGEISHHAVTTFFLAGMVAGVTAGYAISPITFYAFVLPASLPLGLHLFIEGSDLGITMSIMLCLYIFFSIMTYKVINKHITNSLMFDIENHRKVQELTEKQSELAYKYRMATLGELSSNIAHEINNPLAVLKTGLHMLRSSLEQKDQKIEYAFKMCDRLEKTTDRISETVNALKAFSKDNKSVQYELASLENIVNDCLAIAKEKFKNSGIKLELEGVKGNTQIICYPAQIRQVFLNLINNAFDAVKEKGRKNKWVKINLEEAHNKVIIRVTDCGTGIPLELQENIFQPFYSTKSGYSGTGLGLAMVVGIIKKHQGDVWINNQSKHTEFVIELPKDLISEKNTPQSQAS